MWVKYILRKCYRVNLHLISAIDLQIDYHWFLDFPLCRIDKKLYHNIIKLYLYIDYEYIFHGTPTMLYVNHVHSSF